MKVIRTIKLKLNKPISIFLETFEEYTKAYNYVCKIGYETHDKCMPSLHHKTYYTLRNTLPAQLCISAICTAAATLKSIHKKNSKCPKSKRTSIELDSNSYNAWFDKNQISILLLGGRKRFNIQISEYFKQYLTWKRKSAKLFIRKNKVFINIVMEKDIPEPITNNQTYGIDRGVNNIAVISNNTFYGGGHVKKISYRYQNLRANLQKCGSKSAKRHLRQISGKENRFRTDTNHCISKQIVNSIPSGSTIVLENLKNIRENSKKFRKKERTLIHNWSFFQLEMFLQYKTQMRGILVDYTDARYTSQKCSKCGTIDKNNRKTQSQFKCTHCEFSLNADLNASRNISQNYQDAIRHLDRAAVNQPIVVRNSRFSGTTNSAL